ncbi:MAG: HAD family hydrolase [Nitrosopumilus sp.]|nr:HAD family hydrolase [Nitrosopumilus sp.]
MQIKVSRKTFFIFDLDDTLFYELDFLKSAYKNISKQLSAIINKDIYEDMLELYHKKENTFNWLTDKYKNVAPFLTNEWLLKEYREHIPTIALSDETSNFLQKARSCAIPMGLITDGRSLTQRNKLKALDIDKYFTDIIISEEFGSEKPDERNYLYFVNKYPGKEFYFFGDNTSKDFIVPIKLGWTLICIKNSGYSIHLQDLDKLPILSDKISNFNEINIKPLIA